MLVSQRRQNVPFSLYSPFFPQNTGRKCLGEGERTVVVKKVIRQEQGTEFSMEDPLNPLKLHRCRVAAVNQTQAEAAFSILQFNILVWLLLVPDGN